MQRRWNSRSASFQRYGRNRKSMHNPTEIKNNELSATCTKGKKFTKPIKKIEKELFLYKNPSVRIIQNHPELVP